LIAFLRFHPVRLALFTVTKEASLDDPLLLVLRVRMYFGLQDHLLYTTVQASLIHE